MEHFAGLDVSVKKSSVCIVDDTGRIVREVKVASEPEDNQRSCTNAWRGDDRLFDVLGLESSWPFTLDKGWLPVDDQAIAFSSTLLAPGTLE